MDGDSGDEGKDELTCVRSDKNDKSPVLSYCYINIRNAFPASPSKVPLQRLCNDITNQYIF